MPSRSSSSSTTSCGPRAWPARSSTPSRPPGATPDSRSPTGSCSTLDGDDAVLAAARAHEGYIAGETLAVGVAYEPLDAVEPVTVDGLALRVAVALA